MNYRYLIPVVVCFLLGGCAIGKTKYACPSPGGVACKSAPDVYTLTDAPGDEGLDAAQNVLVDPDTHKPMSGKDGKSARTIDGPASASASSPPAAPIVVPHVGDVVPVRSPAQVMRIWIAPWEDQDGNLHTGGRVFTQIEPQRWSVGEPAPAVTPAFYPLQVDTGANDPSKKSNTATTGSHPAGSAMESGSR